MHNLTILTQLTLIRYFQQIQNDLGPTVRNHSFFLHLSGRYLQKAVLYKSTIANACREKVKTTEKTAYLNHKIGIDR